MTPNAPFSKKHELTIEDQIKRALSPIKITRPAFDKANYVSRRICELMGSGVELGFFLLDDIPDGGNQEVVIRDVYIGHEQEVSSTRCNISGLGRILSFRDIRDNLKKRVVGWGHSHARMDTYYSYTDDHTIIDVLKDLGIKRQQYVENDLTPKIGSIGIVSRKGKKCLEIVMEEGEVPYRIYSSWFDALDLSFGADIPFSIFRQGEIVVSYLLGLTFNAHGNDPFCAIAYMHNGEPMRIGGNIRYEVIDEGEPLTDEPVIDKELFERVSNLKRKITGKLAGLRGGYEKAQDYLIKCQQLNLEISSEGNYSMLRHLHDLTRKAKRLDSMLYELSCLANMYRRIVPDSPAFREEQKLAECIVGCRNKVLRKISSERQMYVSRLEMLRDELDTRSSWGMLRTRELEEAIQSYGDILARIDSYLERNKKPDMPSSMSDMQSGRCGAGHNG